MTGCRLRDCVKVDMFLCVNSQPIIGKPPEWKNYKMNGNPNSVSFPFIFKTIRNMIQFVQKFNRNFQLFFFHSTGGRGDQLWKIPFVYIFLF